MREAQARLAVHWAPAAHCRCGTGTVTGTDIVTTEDQRPVLLAAPCSGSAYTSKLRGELIEPHRVGDAAHFAALLVGEAHDQREGCGFQPLHFRAVRIERSDLGAGG